MLLRAERSSLGRALWNAPLWNTVGGDTKYLSFSLRVVQRVQEKGGVAQNDGDVLRAEAEGDRRSSPDEGLE